MNFNILYVFLLYLAILIHIVSARYDANITRKKPRDIDYEEEQLLQISTDSCYDVTHIAYSGDQEPQFNFFPSSVSCVDTEETYIRELGDVSAFCPPGLVDLKVEPVAILKGTGSYPTMNLKITANVFSKVEAIFIRLQCIESPDAEDTYCHDKSKMTNNGRWIHPCRGIQFKGEKEVDYPLTFGYACFRLFGLTHTMVNVTVFPQNCRQTIDFAAPRDTKLFPEIRRFYAKPNPQEQKRSTWSPMLEVDLRDPDGVWFRLEGPDEGYRAVDEVELLIYENMARVKSLTEPVLKLREIFHLRYPQRSVKWSAAKAGSYFVHAKTAFGGCQDTCKGQPEDCHVCSFITHNFNIDRPFMTIGNKVVRFAVDYIWVMVGVLTVLVILIAIFGFGLTWRMRQKAIHAANNPKTMELTEYSETLLIYADDCPEERTVIEELFKCLQSDAAARVFVDSEELNYIGAQPGLWLANCFCSVDKVLLIMSPCVPEMIAIKDRKVLKQERPYPDCLFPGYNMIVNACTSMVNNPAIRGKQASAKDQKEPLIAKSPQHRFAIVRFHFSPPTPPQLQVLGLSEFELPKEFPLLTAFLHNLDSKEYIFGQNLSVENEMSLMSAVCAMSEKTFGNTNWKEERWEREENLRKGELHELKPAVRAPMETHGEMEKVAESYSILPPDNEAEEVTTTAETFNLLPPDSDGEDTESENDDEEPKKSPDSTPTLKKKLIASDKQKDQKIVTQLMFPGGSMDLKNGRITPIGTSTSTS